MHIAHSRSRGTRKGIQLPRQMLPVSSEAEKASCRLSCCSSSDAVLDVRGGGRRLAALLEGRLKAALDAVLALNEGRELALLLGAEAAAAPVDIRIGKRSEVIRVACLVVPSFVVPSLVVVSEHLVDDVDDAVAGLDVWDDHLRDAVVTKDGADEDGVGCKSLTAEVDGFPVHGGDAGSVLFSETGDERQNVFRRENAGDGVPAEDLGDSL